MKACLFTMNVYYLLYQSVLWTLSLHSVSCQCGREIPPQTCNGMFPHLPISSGKCCSIPQVPPDSVEIYYSGTQTNNPEERWRLDATLRWQAPNNDDGFTYSIDFSPTVTLEDLELFSLEAFTVRAPCCLEGKMNLHSCPTTSYFSILVEEEFANFTSLLFGFTYTFQIQTIYNGTVSAGYSCNQTCFQNDALFSLRAPDCLTVTGDIEFCRQQPIPVSTEPRDVEVEWVKESTSAIINLTWTMPIVVNGEIDSYTIYGYRGESAFVVFQTSEVNDTKLQITPNDPGISDGGFMRGFLYIFMIEPLVYLPVQYRSKDKFGGNVATKRIYIPLMDVASSERSQTVTEIARSSTTTGGGEAPSQLLLVLAVASPIFTVLVIIVFVLILLAYRRNRKAIVHNYGITLHTFPPRHEATEEQALPEFRGKEIFQIDDINLVGDPIGSGQYGMVYIGYLRLEKNAGDGTKVAVKTTKDGLSSAMQEEFLDEIRLMLEIGEHPNIMSVIACKTIAEPYYLITEYMEYGSLKDYLRKCKKPEYVQLDSKYMLTGLGQLNIAYQIANGMAYLSSTRYFHGDLAARNVLINKNMEVKISDFGLSNDIYAKGYFRLPPENKRPVKWYSPEANIHGRCSTAGDVWSYGVVLYEIYIFGGEPYPGMTPREVIVRIKSGYRLEKPEDCPDEIYAIMCKCWQYEPSERPTFDSIKLSVGKLLDDGDLSEEEQEKDKQEEGEGEEQEDEGNEDEKSSDQDDLVVPLEYRDSRASMVSYFSYIGDEEEKPESIYD